MGDDRIRAIRARAVAPSPRRAARHSPSTARSAGTPANGAGEFTGRSRAWPSRGLAHLGRSVEQENVKRRKCHGAVQAASRKDVERLSANLNRLRGAAEVHDKGEAISGIWTLADRQLDLAWQFEPPVDWRPYAQDGEDRRRRFERKRGPEEQRRTQASAIANQGRCTRVVVVAVLGKDFGFVRVEPDDLIEAGRVTRSCINPAPTQDWSRFRTENPGGVRHGDATEICYGTGERPITHLPGQVLVARPGAEDHGAPVPDILVEQCRGVR